MTVDPRAFLCSPGWRAHRHEQEHLERGGSQRLREVHGTVWPELLPRLQLRLQGEGLLRVPVHVLGRRQHPLAGVNLPADGSSSLENLACSITASFTQVNSHMANPNEVITRRSLYQQN